MGYGRTEALDDKYLKMACDFEVSRLGNGLALPGLSEAPGFSRSTNSLTSSSTCLESKLSAAEKAEAV